MKNLDDLRTKGALDPEKLGVEARGGRPGAKKDPDPKPEPKEPKNGGDHAGSSS